MQRKIRKVAVLGSGVMGSRIACHFANIGLDVLLLDIVPKSLTENELKDKSKRNSIVQTALQNAIKSSPSPLYHPSFAKRIKTGNFEDDMPLIESCDWIIEVVVELLEIKKQVFEQVEKYRRPGSLITTNTSGIPIESMLEGRSEDFCAHFCGTHFFNPPRYLKLFEIIPSSKTSSEIISFFEYYAFTFLGKTPVICKDTPAFIANRVGVFSMMAVFQLMQKMDMRIDEIDALTGVLTGKPKSASFRTGDVVGLDTLVKVANGVSTNCEKDEMREVFTIPPFIEKMLEQKWLGDKTGQGFYKMDKTSGKKEITVLDWKTMEYIPQIKAKSKTIETKSIESLKARLIAIDKLDDRDAQFLQAHNAMIFAYVLNRFGEIADKIYLIDDAIKAGFGWELGPFEQIDNLGLARVEKLLKQFNYSIPAWFNKMITENIPSFYRIEKGNLQYYHIQEGKYLDIENRKGIIKIDNYRQQSPIWKNAGSTIHDIGDGVICLEIQTKMNAIGGEVLEGIHKAIDLAERDYKGIMIGSDAPNFSAGANLAMIFMMAVEQEFEELDMTVRHFQNTMMRVRHSAIPIITVPRGMTLGGGCELVMHSDAAIAQPETYMGLVEVGVGLIPAGGGTKEFAQRISDSSLAQDPIMPLLAARFTHIATAKTSTSAHEAFDIGVLDKYRDLVVFNSDRALSIAKNKVLELHDRGYVSPLRRSDILVQGKAGLAGLYAGIAGFEIGGYASAHDKKIAEKVAWVLCGGDLSQPTLVTDQYLLDLEREAFLSLLGEKKTLERIQSILTTGKPLRN